MCKISYLTFVMVHMILAQNSNLLALDEVCSCAQLPENQCKNMCSWRNNSCETAQCQDLQSSQCSASKNCFWDGAACKQAYSCIDWSQSKVQCLRAPKHMRCQYEQDKCVRANTQSLITNCRLITNQNICSQSNCVWGPQGCTLFLDCSQANGLEETCMTNESCLFKEGVCYQKSCGDYITEDTCTYVSSFNGDKGVSCQWLDNICQQTDPINSLSIDTCTRNTGFTHFWNGNNCQKCVKNSKQLRQLSSCTKTIAQTQYSFTDSQICKCTVMLNSQDCINVSGCIWKDNSCHNSSCENQTTSTNCTSSSGCVWENNACRTFKQCSDWKTESECDASYAGFECAWNGNCNKFTQCSDYTASSVSNCNQKSSSTSICIETSSSNNQCKDFDKINCSDITMSSLCDSFGCVWNSQGSCQSFTQCSDANGNSQACSRKSACKYCGEKCTENTCEDYATPEQCTYHMNFAENIGYLCKWENSKCSYAKDTTFLTASTCQANTAQTHTWNGSSCVLCASSEHSNIAYDSKCQVQAQGGGQGQCYTSSSSSKMAVIVSLILSSTLFS